MTRTDPIDIPPEGRYTFVVTAAGQNAAGDEVIQCVISGGRFNGRRVSSVVQSGFRRGHAFAADLRVWWYAMDGTEVAPDYRDGNLRVRYSLENFGRIDGQTSSIPLTDQRARFRRTPK